MRHAVTTFVPSLVLIAATAARAQDNGLTDLQKQYSQSAMKWTGDRNRHPATEFLPKFRQFADDHAGTPEALSALTWILSNIPMANIGMPEQVTTLRWAIDRLARDHLKDAGLQNTFPILRYASSYVGPQPTIDFFEKVIDAAPDSMTKGAAMFYEAIVVAGGPAGQGADAAGRKRAAALFRKVTKDYPGTQFAMEAEGFIYEVENLQVGCKAPEIEGEDADGNKIRLSQFKGQVVVLDFWGFW